MKQFSKNNPKFKKAPKEKKPPRVVVGVSMSGELKHKLEVQAINSNSTVSSYCADILENSVQVSPEALAVLQETAKEFGLTLSKAVDAHLFGDIGSL